MKRNLKRVSRVLLFTIMFSLVGQNIFTAPTEAAPATKENMQIKVDKLRSKTIPVGKIQKSEEDFKLGDVNLPNYKCMGMSYVVVSDLKKAGGNVFWDGATGKIVIYDLSQRITENPQFEKLAENSIGYLGRDAVYINYQEIPAIFVNGKALIATKWIPSILIDQKSKQTKEVKKDRDINTENLGIEGLEIEGLEIEGLEIEGLHIEDLGIENFGIKELETIGADVEEIVVEADVEEIVEVDEMEDKGIKGINIWFDGKDYIEQAYDFSEQDLEGYGYYRDLRYHEKTDYIYVGFVITKFHGILNSEVGNHKAWLKNPSYYTIPEAPTQEIVTTLFPNTRVKGIMKYASGGFAKGEVVNVKQASSNSKYYLTNASGKVITVPWGSVAIQKSPVTKEQATNEEIEHYVNSKGFSSKTNYFVWTDIYRQRTYVFQGSKNKWKIIKNFVCSTGKDTHLTPVGSYTLNVRVPSFGGSQYRVKNAYAFIGTSYLYHSVLYDPTGTYLLSSWGKLGNKASSGCIRLAPEDSVWFYKTLPIGTGIFIN